MAYEKNVYNYNAYNYNKSSSQIHHFKIFCYVKIIPFCVIGDKVFKAVFYDKNIPPSSLYAICLVY